MSHEHKKRKGGDHNPNHNQIAGGIAKKWKAAPVAPGQRGIMVSCATGRQRDSEREFLPLLEELSDEIYGKPQLEDSNQDVAPDSAGDGLLAELAALKKEASQPKRKQRFQRFDFVVTGLYFVNIADNSVDPNALVTRLLTDIQQQKSSRTRFTMRVTPVQQVCHSSIESMEVVLKQMLTEEFTNNKIPESFAIVLNSRAHTTFDKKGAIVRIAQIVEEVAGKPVKVDLDNQELTIIVDVTARVACLSLVHNYHQLNKFSIFSILGLGPAGNKSKEVNAPKEEAETESGKPEEDEHDDGNDNDEEDPTTAAATATDSSSSNE